MNQFLRTDPIATISTGTKDHCAIGIIRLTGFKNLDFIDQLTGLKVDQVKPRYAHFVKVYDSDKALLDEGILLYFKEGSSYTGENLLELQLHGNPIQLEKILIDLCDRFGFLRALPGEFTYRAFRNKKLSLSQVEGLDLLLNASSTAAIDSGLSLLNGALNNEYLALKSSFMRLSSALEMAIDFSEDIGEQEAEKGLREASDEFTKRLDTLYQGCLGDLSHLRVPSVVMSGKPNAGKSTLFNKFLSFDRAIVSDLAGTTRDFISENIYINKKVYRLVDTAGLRHADHEIERQGIDKALELVNEAFYNILVINPFDVVDLDVDIDLYDCVVFTHGDLEGFVDKVSQFKNLMGHSILFSVSKSGPIEPMCIDEAGAGPIEPGVVGDSGPIGPKKSFNTGPMGPVSSERSSGSIGPAENNFTGPIEPLIKSINNKYLDGIAENTVDISRQRDVIKFIYNFWVRDGNRNNINDLGVYSDSVRIVGSRVEELVGVVASEDVLNNIFENFCIGK